VRALYAELWPFAKGGVARLAVALRTPDPRAPPAGRKAQAKSIAIVDPLLTLPVAAERLNFRLSECHGFTATSLETLCATLQNENSAK
jgi:hypothetical protein